MKIIKPKKSWWKGYKLSCDQCDSKLELEENDSPTKGLYIFFPYYLIKCPNCQNLITFRRKLLS